MNNHLKNLFIRWYFDEFSQDPLFLKMAETVENSPYHREKSVGIHTNMVVTEYIGLTSDVEWDFTTIQGALAAAFHDVGKPAACEKNGIKFKPERGNYLSFGGHEQISARLWEDYAVRNWHRLQELFGLVPEEIYAVSVIIEYHLPWGVTKTDKLNNIAQTMRYATGDPSVFTNVILADTLGRISDDQIEKRQKVTDWIDNFKNVILPRQEEIQVVKLQESQPELIMPIAASASGKSTYRETLDNCEMYSWDDLRLEFYSQDYDEAYEMASADKKFMSKVNARFMETLKTGNNIYVDNINASKKRRSFFVREAKRKGYFVRAVLMPIALDTIIDRQQTRDGKIVPEYAVRNQYMNLQMPQYGEFNAVTVLGANLPTP